MTVEWDKVTLYRNRNIIDATDPLLKTKNNTAEEKQYVYERKKMVPPEEMIYTVEEGYKGAHFDHHYNWINAIRTKGKVTEDALFGFRAAAPALLCNQSYFDNKIIQWDPEKLKVIS
jgi:hypothetical protein